LEAALLEGDLVELGVRDIPLAGARLAHAHRLAIAPEVLARQAQALARFEERHEAGAQLEGEPALQVRALGRRRVLAAMRRRQAGAPLARQQDLLLEPDLGHDRVTHADATRVGATEGEVGGPRRERRVRQQAGGDHVAVGRTHVQRAGQQLGVLPAQPPQRLVERQAHRVLPAGRGAEGQHEREHEPAPPSTAARSPRPSARSALICETRTTPFSTTWPMSAMKPMHAETLRLSRATSRPTTPPTSANGMVARMRSAHRSEPKVWNRMARMSAIDTGMMMARRAMARRWFSNSPPQVRNEFGGS